MTDRKTAKAKITEEVAFEEVKSTVPFIEVEPSQSDIFKPLGSTTVDNVATRSYAAEVGDELILKTVTTTVDGQSEALLPLQGMKLVPTSVNGYFKVVKA